MDSYGKQVMSNIKQKCPGCGNEYAVKERHIGVVMKRANYQKPFHDAPVFASAQKRFKGTQFSCLVLCAEEQSRMVP